MSVFSPAPISDDIVVFEGKSGYCNPDEIIINPRYRSLLPRPTKKEYADIKKSIVENGQQKAVEVDQHMGMVDGFTRLEICEDIGRKVFFESRYYENKTAILRQMAILNLHRRHITDYAKVLLYDEIYQDEKKQAEKRSKLALELATLKNRVGDTKEEETKVEKEIDTIGTGRAIDKFSKIINVSPATVKRSQFVAKYGDSEIKQKVKKKEMSLSKAYYKTREKVDKKQQPKEKMKGYTFTITPDKGSGWKTRRMLKPSQIGSIKAFILHLKVKD